MWPSVSPTCVKHLNKSCRKKTDTEKRSTRVYAISSLVEARLFFPFRPKTGILYSFLCIEFLERPPERDIKNDLYYFSKTEIFMRGRSSFFSLIGDYEWLVSNCEKLLAFQICLFLLKYVPSHLCLRLALAPTTDTKVYVLLFHWLSDRIFAGRASYDWM